MHRLATNEVPSVVLRHRFFHIVSLKTRSSMGVEPGLACMRSSTIPKRLIRVIERNECQDCSLITSFATITMSYRSGHIRVTRHTGISLRPSVRHNVWYTSMDFSSIQKCVKCLRQYRSSASGCSMFIVGLDTVRLHAVKHVSTSCRKLYQSINHGAADGGAEDVNLVVSFTCELFRSVQTLNFFVFRTG